MMSTLPEPRVRGSASNLTSLWEGLLIHLIVLGVFLGVGTIIRILVPISW